MTPRIAAPASPQPVCLYDARNTLGEGPLWDSSRGRLWWCDIKASRLWWMDESGGPAGCADLPFRPSALALKRDGTLLLATDVGLVDLEPASLEHAVRAPLEAEPGFRTNDGKVDRAGRFWWSSMDDNEGARPGRLFVLHPDGRNEIGLEAVGIANCMSTSPDGRTFYLADGLEQSLFAFDLDPATARLSNRRLFATLRGGQGAPDGGAVDAEGFLWSCQWGAWRLVRYAPDGGIDRIVPMPVEQPTSCAFGGPDLETLYVTSARVGLSEEQLAEQPDAGGLFAFQPGVSGLSIPRFDG